jgi:muramoyltetrapeptide carboxypeptidase
VIGYSDITSLHIFLNCHVGMTSVHGVMVQRYLAGGPGAYDEASMRGSLGTEPMGELAPPALETLRPGQAGGPILGGCLTEVLASLGTPFAFDPPAGYVLFLEEVNERPYRIRRGLVQLTQAGVLQRAGAIVFGQMLGCDEPNGKLTAKAAIADLLRDFPGPIVFGLPSGHTDRSLVSIPLGAGVRIVTDDRPRVIFEEAAAG